MADKQDNGGGTTVTVAGFSVHALHILEQVIQEAEAYGISLGVGLVYELIQKVAVRASELHDAELDRLMNKLHLYEDMELCEKEGGETK